ncbi:hypothetical protein Afil01_40540 [Actinorhabdospora filicis]|uniref:DUF4184 family protein n=1 Tax=Actinorhabdospora filicis TaxID=1785913 RepID=A0A9W6SP00_9ACTN|nr:DUF4184 family protein [Actinorhabdospora filicis]GLZ79247.1 hypothetical protein Afil01_40540 [Actinorhabdospora filicis]
MPITLPAHPAAVLPLKQRWPKRVDGVAAVIGSIAPDLAYAFIPAWNVDSHGWLSLLYWSLPITVVLAVLVRRAVLPAAVHMPDLGQLHPRDLAASASVRHALPITAYSALAGAASHIVWDLFTHESGLPLWLPMLMEPSPLGVPWFKTLQYGSGVAGTLVTAWCVLQIGRHRMLMRWHGEPPPSGSRARTWWPVFAAAVVPSVVLAIQLPDGRFPHILMSRAIWCAILAAAVATLLTRVGDRRRSMRER